MRKHWAYFLLALVLIQTGIAGSVISVSHTRDREHLSITCRLLSENDTVSQINWEMISSPNHTTTKLKLGTFHPVFGTYVVPEYNDTVKIQSSASSRSSKLDLKEGAVEEVSQLCCVFITFPSGVLEHCTHTRINESTAEAQESEDAPRLLGERTLEQWALLVGGSTICILSIVTSLYYCWKYCCRHCCHRRRMFEVEAYLTDQHTESEGVTEDPPKQPPLPPPPQPQPQGFDPSKLYAKIKLDLLYGRLWKAYQGTATTWGPTTQHGPQQGPQQVAEPGPQKREEPEESVLQLEPELELEPEHQPALEGREEPVTEPETESELIPPPTLDPGTQMEEMESDTGL
ncbi:protein TsetseEP-like isoform X1 [Salvelinus fontinalis]|uniref:protein TsetseEP-like isoform X1 n=1 Tax=Salvelinus fontinalis TaxID=8038 RepID=UPI002484F51A|nr:protein TsetseEP-like isoform X1 [Salvelinus fontinalis]